MNDHIRKGSRSSFETIPYHALGSAELERARNGRETIVREMAYAYADARWGSDLSGIRAAADARWAEFLAGMELSDPNDEAHLGRLYRRGSDRVSLRFAAKRLSKHSPPKDVIRVALFVLGMLAVVALSAYLGIEFIIPRDHEFKG